MQSSLERGACLLASEIAEHVARGGHADGVAAQDRLVSDIADQHTLTNAVGSEHHHVDPLPEEAERERVLHGIAIDLLRPRPVEVGHGLEGTDARVAHASLEAAALPLAFLIIAQLGDPWLIGDERPVGEQTKETESLDTAPQIVRFGPGGVSRFHRR